MISVIVYRELDPAVLQLAEKPGLKVFPKQWSDLKMQCSCPDWAVPRKHLASVIYKGSTVIDNNPFLVFSLYNVDLLQELEKFGIVINKQNIEIPKIKDLYFDRTGQKGEYNPENTYRKLSFSKLTPTHGALTALLSPCPAFYTSSTIDFRKKYLSTLNPDCKKHIPGSHRKNYIARIFCMRIFRRTKNYTNISHRQRKCRLSNLKPEIYHGSQRDLKKLNCYDVLITSYGIARSDADLLKKLK